MAYFKERYCADNFKAKISFHWQNLTLGSGLVLAQAVSRQPLTAETRFCFRSVHAGFVVDKVALGQDFPRDLRLSLSTSLHRSSPYSCYLGCE
jgi:hypothetical protein